VAVGFKDIKTGVHCVMAPIILEDEISCSNGIAIEPKTKLMR
jgi:hypothetical protein